MFTTDESAITWTGGGETLRVEAWGRIARDLPMEKLEAMVQPATLSDLPQLGRDILKGRVKGRVVVDVNA